MKNYEKHHFLVIFWCFLRFKFHIILWNFMQFRAKNDENHRFLGIFEHILCKFNDFWVFFGNIS